MDGGGGGAGRRARLLRLPRAVGAHGPHPTAGRGGLHRRRQDVQEGRGQPGATSAGSGRLSARLPERLVLSAGDERPQPRPGTERQRAR